MKVTHELLKLIIADQQEEHKIPVDYIPRAIEAKVLKLSLNKEIIILTGLRRAGKSVVLQYIRKKLKEFDYYFNFEDERLANFTVSDFQTLHEVFIELFGLQKTFYFDEIQNILGWEMFVRRLYNAGNKIYITGSNANLFSEELGTRLTGRYISLDVYPISLVEYIHYKNKALIDKKTLSTAQIGQIKKLFSDYNKVGGIPEYIKYRHLEYLHSLYESIIYRDIVTRYKLPQANVLKKLVFFLASNCSKEMTYNSLRRLLSVGSSTTVSDYCHYLENSYLCFFVNRYSESVKTQMLSPKKVYFIDIVIARILGFRISEDYGRILENLVFLELKRRQYEIFYHREEKECDFIIRKDAKTIQAIQVSKDITDAKTKKREIEGLAEALIRCSLTEGLIITENDDYEEEITVKGQILRVIFIPIWKWLLNN